MHNMQHPVDPKLTMWNFRYTSTPKNWNELFPEPELRTGLLTLKPVPPEPEEVKKELEAGFTQNRKSVPLGNWHQVWFKQSNHLDALNTRTTIKKVKKNIS